MNHQQILSENAPFDWREAGKVLGASTKQILFAMAKARGANNTRAAKASGYGGGDAHLAKVGYRVNRGDKVQALLKWAEEAGGGFGDAPCEGDELKQILARHARSDDAGASIRAVEALHRLKQREDELASAEDDLIDPKAMLDKIAKVNPTYALLLAEHHQVQWDHEGSKALDRCSHCGQLIAPKPNGTGGHQVAATAQR